MLTNWQHSDLKSLSMTKCPMLFCTVRTQTGFTSLNPLPLEIEQMTKNVNSGKIYVTAFPDVKTFKRFAEELAWETEVWISDMPDHMIHLNGDRFMGPRS